MIRAIAADDEPAALRGLHAFLDDRDDFEVVGTARSGAALTELLQATAADVAFVDVRLGDMTAFEALDLVDGPLPHIVFVSAYEEYAVRAFEKHAIDFLLKPFSERRFTETCARLRTRLASDRPPPEGQRIKELLAELVGLLGPDALRDIRGVGAGTRFAVRSGGNVVIVPAADVVWARAARDYVRLHTADDAYLVRETMSALEAKLAREGFVRIHRSTLVRTSAIAEVRRTSAGRVEAVLEDGTSHPVSRSGHRNIERVLGLAF